MIHPIFPAVLRSPEVVLRHLSNYVALIKCEAHDAVGGMIRQAVGVLLAAMSLLLALGFTGTALMLGALHGQLHWILVLVPAIAWLATLIGVLMAVRSRLPKELAEVREEVEIDLRLLRQAKGAQDG